MLRYSVIYSTPLQKDSIILNYQVADLIAQLVLHLDRHNIIQIQYRITRKADQVVGTLPQSCYPRDGQRLKVKGQNGFCTHAHVVEPNKNRTARSSLN